MFFTVVTHMKNSVIMSFKNKLFKEMLKMSSTATQKASKFLLLLLQWTQPNPTLGQPNPWTTLISLYHRSEMLRISQSTLSASVAAAVDMRFCVGLRRAGSRHPGRAGCVVHRAVYVDDGWMDGDRLIMRTTQH